VGLFLDVAPDKIVVDAKVLEKERVRALAENPLLPRAVSWGSGKIL